MLYIYIYIFEIYIHTYMHIFIEHNSVHVRIYDITARKNVHTLTHKAAVLSSVWVDNKGKKYIVVSTCDYAITVWDTQSGLYSVLQCITVCFGVLRRVAIIFCDYTITVYDAQSWVYIVLQCVAVCCSVWQCVAEYCST